MSYTTIACSSIFAARGFDRHNDTCLRAMNLHGCCLRLHMKACCTLALISKRYTRGDGEVDLVMVWELITIWCERGLGLMAVRRERGSLHTVVGSAAVAI